MDELIDPEPTYLIYLVLMLSFNLIFNNETMIMTNGVREVQE